MNTKIIQPRVLKGFRDYLPDLMLNRKKMLRQIEDIFESYGFAPIDTPCLEYTEILLGKGGNETDKQLFRFTDNGGRDVTMRFDLTVPLARFTAQHYNDLGMPFKAYHIAPVWRGENTHRGRYREFYQCDFDILGTNSNRADIEIGSVIYKSIKTLINSDNFQIKINNRSILNGLMQKLNLLEKTADVLRVIDKIAKVPLEKIEQELTESVGISQEDTAKILKFINTKGSNQEILKELNQIFAENEDALTGVRNLEEMVNTFRSLGIPDKCYQIDLSIARGLDYYTGTVFETFLDQMPEIGSVCSGGRYDNLASLYTKNIVPGVGASVGLDRLIAAMEELKLLKDETTPAQVLITSMDKDLYINYIKIAETLRKAGIKTELYNEDKKLDKQLKYANRKGFKLVLIMGSQEFARNVVNLKVMNTGENIDDVSLKKLPETIHKLLIL